MEYTNRDKVDFDFVSSKNKKDSDYLNKNGYR